MTLPPVDGCGAPAAPQPPTDVLGYITQCHSCGTRALTRTHHGPEWLCPQCDSAEVYTGPFEDADRWNHNPIVQRHETDTLAIPLSEMPRGFIDYQPDDDEPDYGHITA